MIWNNKIATLVVCAALVGGCTKDHGPKAKDNFLNFEVPSVAVTEDFPVGVFYLDPGWNGQDIARYNRLIEVNDVENKKLGPWVKPVFGNYGIERNQSQLSGTMVTMMQQHIDWCIEGGVDFLILPALKAGNLIGLKDENNQNLPFAPAPDCDNGDSRFYDVIRGAVSSAKQGRGKSVDMKSLKFVASMNLEDPLANGNRETYDSEGKKTGQRAKRLDYKTLLEDNDDYVAFIGNNLYTITDIYKEYFKSVAKYFEDEHYFRVNGRPVVVIENAHKLYLKDPIAFYAAMRQAVKDDVINDEMYLVLRQPDPWMPPARMDYLCKGAFDAVTNRNMYQQGDWDRSLFYPQAAFLNWKYSREYFRDKWTRAAGGGTDFIPTGSVAFYPWVDNSNLKNPIVPFNGDTFRTMCNVMKAQAGKDRIVFIDSFNNFQYANFLEPTDPEYGNGHGTLFLDIVKEQFDK